MGLFRRERDVTQMMRDYYKAVDETLDEFDAAIRSWVDHGPGLELREADHRVHEAESRADDQRHEIEMLLYERALLPESRDDLLGLLEAFDNLPNLAESITSRIDLQRVVAPAGLKPEILRLVKVSIEAYRLVREQADDVLAASDHKRGAADRVDKAESVADEVERNLISRLFEADLDLAYKLQVYAIFDGIAGIADHAENIARRLEIISLKRRI